MATVTQKDEPGMAKIKAEFVLLDYKPTLETEYVSNKVMEQLHDSARIDGAGEGEEPPLKRVKLKGRNKKRPKGKQMEPSSRMCTAYVQERECRFGDKCKFSHDSKAFLEAKPEDIGPVCYLYETYGKCPYGLSCRFAKAHLSEDLNNTAKDDIADKKKREGTILNVLKKDIQFALWKRKYDFSKSDAVLAKVCPGAFHQKNKTAKKGGDKNPAPAVSLENVEKKNDNASDKSIPLLEEAGSSPPVNVDQCQNETLTVNSSGEKDALKKETESICTLAVEENKKEIKLDANDGALKNGNTPSSVTTAEGSVTTAEAVPKETGVAMDTLDLGEEGVIRLRPQEKKKIDFKDKLYLAPLTTVGNLPYRRICKRLGADITCGEMAVCTNLLQGQQSEWALLKRHESEDLFGVQLCGAYPDSMTRCAQLITETMDVDFIDINCGCPIDLIFNKGEGSALMGRASKFEQIVRSMTSMMEVPLTVKLRTGIYSDKNIAHTLVPKLRDWGVALTTVHGRSRVQRYTRLADWDYINECAELAKPMPLFGNGDILSYEDANLRRQQTGISGLMIARGALIKPWIFTEIKEQRHWDISSSERFDLLKDYANYGLDHWGSDHQGVENTRRFMLEWMSFLYRYIPVGILERVPQQINERPPYYKGRDDMETLMASPSCGDWIKISEMLLGPVPEGFTFLPKHKANAYK